MEQTVTGGEWTMCVQAAEPRVEPPDDTGNKEIAKPESYHTWSDPSRTD